MFRRLFLFVCLVSACRAADEKFGPYAEPDFPVLTSTVDFSDWEKLGFPKNNVAVRGLIIKLPHDLYVCFDQDLLRVAGIWQGEPGGKFLTHTDIAGISYNIENKKSEPGQKDLPKPIGKPLMATGLMPGWILKAARDVTPEDLKDPRPPGPDPNEPGRGPLPAEDFRWEGYRLGRDAVVLKYRVGKADIAESFAAGLTANGPVVRRRFAVFDTSSLMSIMQGTIATAGGIKHLPVLSPSPKIGIWDTFVGLTEGNSVEEVVEFNSLGQKPENLETDLTVVKLGRETACPSGYTIEEVPLPVPNRWHRNVRPSGIAFPSSSVGFICTIDGDVWQFFEIKDSREVVWSRIASGLHEPQSIICDERGRPLVFTRDGIVRLEGVHCANFENFCNAFTQTGESREYPMDMVAKPGGGFYIAKGGQMITRKSSQGGHVLEVSADGKTVTDFCSGLRQPYLGMNPKTGLLTASDQQGHWTVATPIRYIRKGAYYGFEEAAPNPIPPVIDPPACWIPHEVNQSAAGQVWAVDAKMGPLNDRLLHLMYFRPGILTAFLDPDKMQAAIAPTGLEFDFPLLKGAINPADGLLYVVGFRIWGTESKNMAGMARVRPTGKPSAIPTAVRAVPQGIHLRFGQRLDAASLKPEHFAASRWNYKRTSGYGSAHYKLDGKPGMEPLPCVGAQLSADGMGVLVHLPDMKPAEQYRLDWRLTAATGTPVNSFTTLTLYELKPFDAAAAGFDATFKPSAPPVMVTEAKEEPTMETGKQLISTLGCLACHSTDGKMEGMKGPTWKDLFGSENELVSGKKVTADVAYLRESILKPAANVRKGFNNPDVGMPPYEGILNGSEVDSIILYLRSLSKEGHVQ